jgi:hypothetical protein
MGFLRKKMVLFPLVYAMLASLDKKGNVRGSHLANGYPHGKIGEIHAAEGGIHRIDRPRIGLKVGS